MSYLNVPRVHFAGKFKADPSTIDNNRNDFDPNAPLSQNPNDKYSVYWNSAGKHDFEFVDCTVRGAVDGAGTNLGDNSSDAILGASVLTIQEKYQYSAKLVDLDVDQQMISQIWGLQLRLNLLDPQDPTSVLGSLTGEMPVAAFADLWVRVLDFDRPRIPWFSAVYQSVLQRLQWDNTDASPLLAQLRKLSPDAISLKFITDSYQSDRNQANFRHGRVVGTLGPAFTGEPVRFLKGRRLSASIPPHQPSPPYGAAGAVWDAKRGRLIFDLGNTVPTRRGQTRTVPQDGWPLRPSQFSVSVVPRAPGPLAAASPGKAGAPAIAGPTALGALSVTEQTYLTSAGIVELAIAPNLVPLMMSSPLVLTDTTDASVPRQAVAEDKNGLYVDVSLPFLRMEPGTSQTLELSALRFGQPAADVTLPLQLVPQDDPDPNNSPAGALQFPGQIVTQLNGTAQLVLMAFDPGSPRGKVFLDGQIYFLGGPWMDYGGIFPMQGGAISVLIFTQYAVPQSPTWTDHVSPLFSYYARVYPGMKTIVNLADYQDVVANAGRIQAVLNLPIEHAHHMPVVRDLSAGKLKMLNAWFNNGMPRA